MLINEPYKHLELARRVSRVIDGPNWRRLVVIEFRRPIGEPVDGAMTSADAQRRTHKRVRNHGRDIQLTPDREGWTSCPPTASDPDMTTDIKDIYATSLRNTRAAELQGVHTMTTVFKGLEHYPTTSASRANTSTRRTARSPASMQP